TSYGHLSGGHVFGSIPGAQRHGELGEHVLALPIAPSAASPAPGAGHCSQVD
ncbi:hypothetical protein A2U01_0110021, partial [Trifolium medium]|nr:hypothetical protein [Trifolium medium]